MQYMLGRYRVLVPYRNPYCNLFRAWKPGKEGYEGYMGDSDNHRLNNYMYARDDQRDHVEAFDCRKIRLIEGNEKCRHLKKLTCKGALRQVFIRVFRLEIQSVIFVFLTRLSELGDVEYC
jgi:hypothetical protein